MSNFDAIQAAVRAQRPAPPVSGLAIASLIIGLVTALPALLAVLLRPDSTLGTLLYLVFVAAPAIAAVVFGHVAQGSVKRGERRGRGMATWGLCLGYFALFGPIASRWVAALAGA